MKNAKITLLLMSDMVKYIKEMRRKMKNVCKQMKKSKIYMKICKNRKNT